jgi:A/G-specific adenine glycosylase
VSESRERQATTITPAHDDIWRDASWRSRVRRRLLDWFGHNARDLPWRRNSTPYRVWVSEVMLQQTQVATVIPYYQRFLKSFPNVHSLADADEQELLSHWEGLGYYRRARSMHAAARQIAESHGGQFPDSFDDVLALPGIGRYTAGAILSISRDMRLPILEGNTQRVFSRWVALRGSATESAASKLLWQFAETMLPRKNPGTFNQAAMELGALVCSPKKPNCDQCPIRGMCRARIAGLQDEIPGKVSRVAYEDRTEFALLVSDQRGKRKRPRYLLRPLPEGGRWAGLWDFPRTTDASFDSAAAAAVELSLCVGAPISPGAKLTTIRHAVTKYRISLHVHFANIEESKQIPGRPWRYVSLAEMSKLPMSVTGRRIAKMLAADGK